MKCSLQILHFINEIWSSASVSTQKALLNDHLLNVLTLTESYFFLFGTGSHKIFRGETTWGNEILQNDYMKGVTTDHLGHQYHAMHFGNDARWRMREQHGTGNDRYREILGLECALSLLQVCIACAVACPNTIIALTMAVRKRDVNEITSIVSTR